MNRYVEFDDSATGMEAEHEYLLSHIDLYLLGEIKHRIVRLAGDPGIREAIVLPIEGLLRREAHD